jgi:hypothetical protein
MKKEVFCYDCEEDCKISSKSKAEIKFCPFCSAQLEERDANELEDDEN